MNSIRARLIVALIAAVGAVWGAGVLWSYHSTQIQIEKVLDSRLMESARMVSSMMAERGTTFAPPGGQSPIFQDGQGYSRQLTCQIWTLEGTLVSSSDNAPPQALAGNMEGFSEREIDGELWRSYTIVNPDLGIRVSVGDKVDFRTDLIADVIKGLLLPLLLMMPVIGGLIWWFVSKGLMPLNKMADALSGRDASNLQPLPATGVPAELAPPVTALNALLERVEQARGRERSFTAYAAHELKTPLAGVKTQAQIALASGDEQIREKALAQILRGVDRTDHLVRQLLDLARIDTAGADTGPTAIRLSELIIEAADDLAFMQTQRGVRVVLEAPEPEPLVSTNSELLRLALRNIIENALAVSPRGHAVSAIVGEKDGQAYVSVTDDGPGMSAQELSSATARFYRGKNSGERGSGLGLSIVEAAMATLGGTLSIGNRPQGGLEVRLAGFRKAGGPGPEAKALADEPVAPTAQLAAIGS
jgi:Signal transduction histidine kinase